MSGRSLKSSLRWLFAERFLRMALTVPVTIWVARTLAPEDFGRLGFALGLATVALWMAQSGLERMLRRDLAERPQDSGVLLGTSMGLTAATAVLGGLTISAYALTSIDDPVTRRLTLILAWGVLPQLFNPAACWFQSVGHPRRTVEVRTAVVLVCALGRITGCLAGWSVEAFALLTLLEWSASAYGVHFFMRREPTAPRVLSFRLSQARAWLVEGWPTLLMVLMTSSFERLDLLLLQRLSTPAEMGYFSAAQRFSELWWSFSTLAAVGFLPWLAEARKKSTELYHDRLQRYADVSVLVTLTAALAATLVLPWLMPALLGPDYARTPAVLVVLCWTALPVYVETMRSQYLLIERKQGWDVFFNLSNMVLLLGLGIYWAPEHGAVGVVYARLVAFVVIIWFLPLLFPATRAVGLSSWKALFFLMRLRGLAQVLQMFVFPRSVRQDGVSNPPA